MTSGNASALSRRDLFRRGKPASAGLDLRPPPAVADFERRCDGCGACVPACAETLLSLAEGRARIDFARGECTFCGDCADACDRGALSRAALADWSGRPAVAASCLGRAGIICRACGEACAHGAIRFAISVGGTPPAIELSACTGCGACVAPCPVGAISIRRAEIAA